MSSSSCSSGTCRGPELSSSAALSSSRALRAGEAGVDERISCQFERMNCQWTSSGPSPSEWPPEYPQLLNTPDEIASQSARANVSHSERRHEESDPPNDGTLLLCPTVVLQCLRVVFALVGPVAVTQELAQRTVLIGQLVDPIEVSVQPQAQHAEHQDALLIHPRSTGVGVGLTLAQSCDTA
jgi:hypothetical protein